MSTLSDLVHAHGEAVDADIEWLHLLIADFQLLADLAFADLVLWIPTQDGGFLAVAHSRPSSSATSPSRSPSTGVCVDVNRIRRATSATRSVPLGFVS